MKKKLVIFIALIAFGFNVQSEENSSKNFLAWNNPNNCICPRCEVKLQSEQRTEKKWFDCYNCGGQGLVNCTKQEWQDCNSCSGTGCKNGYTTGNGKYCAYGHCNTCRGKGGKYVNVMRRECKCNASGCRYDSKSGRYGQWKTGRYYNILVCPRCETEYSGC